MDAPLTKCAHAACDCVLPYGTEYCCTTCGDASGMVELTCQCDHLMCRGEALKPRQQ
jgi:hypothetical protein